MKFKKITCATAKKLFKEGKPFYACPRKLNPSSPWNVAVLILSGKEWREKAERYKDDPKMWKGSVDKTAWELFMNNWKYYNSSYEVGYYPAYYVEA